ncbi:MAG: DUF4340 domain-containing protein [Bacteroidetes bacterium]|nr:DUF4340 domain-containing protein [Bacteroidota bacterium]MDA1121731.1 DUF4340 domain-containing protein [Bacteroidota bacterium]
MLKGFSNIKLLMVLGGLLAVYLIIHFTGGKTKSASLRSTLVELDTAKVTALVIEKGAEQLQVSKIGKDSWEIEIENGKKVVAKTSTVKNAITNLLTLIPSRLASNDPEKWKDYQVDSTGTRVKVYEGDEKTLDVILGRFGVTDQRSYHTFVRLEEDNEIYSVNNFMSISFSPDPASFREQIFLRTKKDSLNTITFNYPDSAFILRKVDRYWLVDDVPADSAKTVAFLNKLGYASSKNFVDDIMSFGQPSLTVRLSANNEDDIIVSGYQLPGKGLVLNSSLNQESYFEDAALSDKLLVGKDYFLASGG